MGKDLETLLNELECELDWLLHKWSEFKELFGMALRGWRFSIQPDRTSSICFRSYCLKTLCCTYAVSRTLPNRGLRETQRKILR